MRRRVFAVVFGAITLCATVSPALAVQRTQRFTLVLTTAASGRAIASGFVNGHGVVNGDEETGVVTVVLPQGSLSFTVIPGTGEEGGNLRACIVTFSSTDTIEILGGTGVFSGASGTGVARSRGIATGSRHPDGTCDPEGEHLSFFAVVRVEANIEPAEPRLAA